MNQNLAFCSYLGKFEKNTSRLSPKLPWGNTRPAVELRIHIPRQANADLKTDRGRVDVRRVAGKLDLSTDRGDVDVNGCDGELRAHGDRGSLNVTETAIRSGLRVNFNRATSTSA